MKTMIAKALAVGAVALATAGGVAGAVDGYCGTPYPGVFTQGPAPRAGIDPDPFQAWHERAGIDPQPFRAPALGSQLGAR